MGAHSWSLDPQFADPDMQHVQMSHKHEITAASAAVGAPVLRVSKEDLA